MTVGMEGRSTEGREGRSRWEVFLIPLEAGELKITSPLEDKNVSRRHLAPENRSVSEKVGRKSALNLNWVSLVLSFRIALAVRF